MRYLYTLRCNDNEGIGPVGDSDCPYQCIYLDRTERRSQPDRVRRRFYREKAYRRKIIDKALEVLQVEIESPAVFTVDESKEG